MKKLKYNQKSLIKRNFEECLNYKSYIKEDEKYTKLLKTKNYYLVYIYQNISNALKNIMRK